MLEASVNKYYENIIHLDSDLMIFNAHNFNFLKQYVNAIKAAKGIPTVVVPATQSLIGNLTNLAQYIFGNNQQIDYI